jgi:hypothetical protein
VFRLTVPWHAGDQVTEPPLPLDPTERTPADV